MHTQGIPVTSMLALRMLPPNDAWLLVFFALVLTAVFIRLSVTFVEMVRGRPTVLRLLAQCTMECGFSVHQNRRRVPSERCTPNGNSFCWVARTNWYADFVLPVEGVHFVCILCAEDAVLVIHTICIHNAYIVQTLCVHITDIVQTLCIHCVYIMQTLYTLCFSFHMDTF
jgi:hypothetical protein